jgi:hypothetical protein
MAQDFESVFASLVTARSLDVRAFVAPRPACPSTRHRNLAEAEKPIDRRREDGRAAGTMTFARRVPLGRHAAIPFGSSALLNVLINSALILSA